MSEIMALSPNRWVDALEQRYTVLHTTEGTSSLAWLRNPASQVSATLLIPREGPDWWRLVNLRDAAWHAGFVASPRTALYSGVNPNLEAEGYEVEGFAAEPITEWQVATVARLILANGHPYCMHADLATEGPYYRSDPGLENFARISLAVTGGNMGAPFTPEQQQAIDNRVREIVMAEDIAPFAVFRALGIYTGNIPKTLDPMAPHTVPGQEIRRNQVWVPRGSVEALGIGSALPSDLAMGGQRGEWPASRGPEPLTREARAHRAKTAGRKTAKRSRRK